MSAIVALPSLPDESSTGLSVTGAWAGVLWPVMFRVWARFTELASQIRINRIRIVGEANRAGRAKRTPEAGLEVKTVDYGP